MKNKKIVTSVLALGLATSIYSIANAVNFKDTVGTKYEGAVEKLYELNIVSGVSNTIFNAERTVTRAEFAKMIVEATLSDEEMDALLVDKNNNSFKDIKPSDWYYDYVIAATNYGLISGYKDNTFKPDKEVTYEEAAKMIVLALGHSYLTEDDPRGWSAQYVDKLQELNINKGMAEAYEKDNATRGNVAIMIWNMMNCHFWAKTELNNTNGFTYTDTGVSPFDKNVKGYSYTRNVVIEGFKEINGELNAKIGKSYYKITDDSNISFDMIGESVDILFRKVRYPEDVYEDEIRIITPTENDTELFAGFIDDLKEEGLSLSKASTVKISSGPDYAFFIQNDDPKLNRAITLNSGKNIIRAEKIKIDIKSEDVKEDADLADEIEEENSDEYDYVESYKALTKTININEEYEINDGAVLFRDNKRVDWSTLEEGDIINEISKDEYYFVSNKTITTTIKDYTVDSKKIEFSTNNGLIKCYQNAEYQPIYSEKLSSIKSLKETELEALKGKKVKFYVDFTDKATRMELLESIAQNETEETADLENLGVGFVAENVTNLASGKIKLIIGDKTKSYRVNGKEISANVGDLVFVEFEKNAITDLKVITGKSTKLNDKYELQKTTYSKVNNSKDIPIYYAKYDYDFGEYDKITGVTVNKISASEMRSKDNDNSEYYALIDSEKNERMIIVIDYSAKKEVFYGRVMDLYTEGKKDEKKDKINISILGYKKMDYFIANPSYFDEGDIVSFKFNDKDTIQVIEKYSPKVLGYYKDIIVKTAERNSKAQVITNNGTIDLKEGILLAGDEEYNINNYVKIFITVGKENENWTIKTAKALEQSELNLQAGDRIAIDEIEDTMIIYRGYSD